MPQAIVLIIQLIFSCAILTPVHAANDLPLIDAHIHYSHDAWDNLPPAKAIEILRAAGLQRALVSSSSDDGTQMLYRQAPDLIVPVLRPYRRRGELASWMQDNTVIEMLKLRLQSNRYAGIGEFHISGDDVNTEVMQAVIGLAQEYGIFLHAHADTRAIENIFRLNPQAVVLWAHSGFDSPDVIAKMLEKYDRLWADLAFRTAHGSGGKVNAEWRQLFIRFPDRFLIGTDTYTPDRWYDVVDHAEWSRRWLNDLPLEIREKIGYRNALQLIDRTTF